MKNSLLKVFGGLLLIGVVLLVVLPSFEEARSASSTNACINNLRQIEGAKSQVALRDGLEPGTPMDTVEMKAKVEELLDGGNPCPQGGTYTYNAIGLTASCTLEDFPGGCRRR